MKRTLLKPNTKTIGLLAVAVSLVCQTAYGQQSYPLKNGVVPDARTATAIADVVLSRIYGADEVKEQKPFNVRLKGNVWVVTGTVPKWKELVPGGIAYIEIAKKDGRVRRISYGE